MTQVATAGRAPLPFVIFQLFSRFHLFSLSPLFPLSLNGPNLSIISIKTKGTKEFIKKKRDKGCEFCATQRKKKKKPQNKSNFLFDNFSYRAESAPRSELAGRRKSVLEETKKELKISIFSGEAKKILLCKVGVRLPSLPLYPTFYWEEPNLTTLAETDKIPSTTLTSFVLLF